MQNYDIKFIDVAYVCHQNMTYAVDQGFPTFLFLRTTKGA
jgi:hypothetical protein